MMAMCEIPSAARDVRSISTVRVRASDHEFMGGLRGMVDVLPLEVRKVRALKVMSVRVAERASKEEREL